MDSKRLLTRGGVAARSFWLSAAPRQRASWSETEKNRYVVISCLLGRCNRQPGCPCRSPAPCLRPFGVHCTS
ncbi:hypothetical protein Y032_0612g664 [Ancylostoma ceylanicum]|uniref:Uncharacterized protein n=1 Tax=Ancylostoma ceylanicum TaxID=53326 RepID=A0A016WKU8_9BILA|nr:hypothetical protein Y032_0612g664 [Ancylostoma ceylanicum]